MLTINFMHLLMRVIISQKEANNKSNIQNINCIQNIKSIDKKSDLYILTIFTQRVTNFKKEFLFPFPVPLCVYYNEHTTLADTTAYITFGREDDKVLLTIDNSKFRN